MKQIAELIEGQTLQVIEPGWNVRRAVVARGLDPDATAVSGVMSTELVVADPSERVDSALQKMHSIGSRHLPVVENGKLVGMISIRDLLEVDDQQQRAKAKFLNELVRYSPDYET
jgi:signal-transduction protein with cAMP-binding, CBS, and nucleotidyltransferase domain